MRSGWPDAVGEGTASNGLRSVRALGVSCSEGVDGQNLSMAEEEMECGVAIHCLIYRGPSVVPLALRVRA